MPTYINGNAHAIRVPRDDKDTTGGRRLVPGQVVEADSAFADALAATPGVRTATSDERERWQNSLAGVGAGGSRIAAKATLGDISQALRVANVVAPLQRVVGDDAAPQGPPSGTITTRGAAATSGKPGDLEAFAQGEELVMQGVKIDGADTPSGVQALDSGITQAQVHNAQVDNAERAEMVARAVIAGEDSGAGPLLASDEPLEPPYVKATSEALSAELARRNMPDESNKPDKVAALEADDKAKADAGGPANEGDK